MSDKQTPYNYKVWFSLQDQKLANDSQTLYMEYLKNWYFINNKTIVDPKEKIKSEIENEPIQEGLMDILKSATGAFKNFLGGITTPFKNLSQDFKKGMKLSEVKNKVITSVFP